MSHSPDESSRSQELLELLELLREDRATQAQVDRIEAIVLADPAAMTLYARYMAMTAGLRHRLAGLPGLAESAIGAGRGGDVGARHGAFGARAASHAASGRARFRPARRRFLFASLTTAAAAIFLAVILWPRERVPPAPPTLPPVVATADSRIRLTLVTGDVRVITAGGATTTPAAGTSQPATAVAELRAGDTINTSGLGSSATLTYADGTRLVLVNDSSLSCLSDARKSVVLHAGIVSAQVTPQPAGAPMLLATPGAKVEVLGTQFAIAASTDRTELNVARGRVRLTRVSDGQTVEVAGGQGVATNGEVRPLVVRDAPAAGAAWSMDFEDGRPKGGRGEFVTTGLPPGSRGALKAVWRADHEVFDIATGEHWVDGLFVVQDDLHLHITIKMDRPNWLNVFFVSHGADGAPPPWALHIFNEMPYWPPNEGGQWRTITIPLAKFKRKRDGIFRDEGPVAGEIVYSLFVSSTEPDRGLVIDRIWITRGGPGVVESKTLP